MSAVLRCVCPRCLGAPDYASVPDYLRAHQGAVVLECEVEVLASVIRHPSSGWRDREDPDLRVATFDDGSQILVTTWATGRIEVATRPDRRATWGPPVELEEAPS